MIKANELRIGNWIIDNEVDPQRTVYYQVEEITYNGVVYRDGSSVTMCDYLQPIPLTEEILLKCGFEKIGQLTFILKGTFINITLIEKADEYICSLSGPFGMVSPRHIKHLHQLQNLYFALTGEELEINL